MVNIEFKFSMIIFKTDPSHITILKYQKYFMSNPSAISNKSRKKLESRLLQDQKPMFFLLMKKNPLILDCFSLIIKVDS